jgi:hypothetical protein
VLFTGAVFCFEELLAALLFFSDEEIVVAILIAFITDEPIFDIIILLSPN